MPRWTGTWSGGRKYQKRNGRTVYVIRKTVEGVAYQHTLDVRTEEQAEAEFALFLREPTAYRPKRQQLDARLGADFLTLYLSYLTQIDRSRAYIDDSRRYLGQWATALKGANLARLPTATVKSALHRWPTARKTRTIVFKAFCAWLRAQGLLDEDSDPSRALKVPASRPERAVRTKGYSKAVVEALYAGLGSQAIRDVLCLRVKAGIHGSEIERIARGGAKVRRLPPGAPIASTVRFAHKSGRIHTVSLDLQATAAALRLQVRGKAPTRTAIQESVARVCKRLGLPKINFGELRHSFVAWVLEEGTQVTYSGSGGVPLANIASVLGHTNPRTTQLFYNVSQVPPMVVVPLQLQHLGDLALAAHS
jgi:integrase